MPPKSTASAKKVFRPSSQVTNTIQILQNSVEDQGAWKQSTSSQLHALHANLRKLQKLQNSQSFASVIPTRTTEKLEAFQKWLKDQHKIDLAQNGLELAFVSNDIQNATLFATRRIPADDVLVTIPSSLMLMSSFSKHRQSLSQFARAVPTIAANPSLALVLSLLAEAADPSSPYAPYIAILPSAHTIPFASFTAKETLALAPSVARATSIMVMRAQVRDYTHVFQAVSRMRPDDLPLNVLSFANWRWAVSVIMSRQNEIPVPPDWNSQSKGSIMACVPLWDMFNHESGQMSTAVIVQERDVVVECHAMRTFETGEAVTMAYGKRPNINLAVFSGFVSDSNMYDEVPVIIPIPIITPLAPLKARVLSKRGFIVEAIHMGLGWLCNVLITAGETCLDNVLTVASILVMDKDAFTAFLKKDETETPPPTLETLQIIEPSLQEKLNVYRRAQHGSNEKDISDKDISSQAKKLIGGLHDAEMSLLIHAIEVLRRHRENLLSEKSSKQDTGEKP